jgi:hypothetical protein
LCITNSHQIPLLVKHPFDSFLVSLTYLVECRYQFPILQLFTEFMPKWRTFWTEWWEYVWLTLRKLKQRLPFRNRSRRIIFKLKNYHSIMSILNQTTDNANTHSFRLRSRVAQFRHEGNEQMLLFLSTPLQHLPLPSSNDDFSSRTLTLPSSPRINFKHSSNIGAMFMFAFAQHSKNRQPNSLHLAWPCSVVTTRSSSISQFVAPITIFGFGSGQLLLICVI